MGESMTWDETAAESTKTAASDCYALGDEVRLLKDIWDDGEDHHPPGYLAHKGEIMLVRKVSETGEVISVSHCHRTDNSYQVYHGEYERS